MTAEETKVAFIAERLSTDLKLLLCQLVLESDPNETWHTLANSFLNHPIVTKLHATESEHLAQNITETTLPAIVKHIVHSTVASEYTPELGVSSSAEPLARTCASLAKTRAAELHRALEKQRRESASLLRTV